MRDIFISHWAEEAPVALVLKDWIENLFGDVHVFVSSSEKNIKYGEKWEDTMMEALKRANVAIVLVSKHSYDRKWIHIETGFCLARELTLLIVRMDDLVPEDMGRPYDNYQSLATESPLFAKKIIEALSELLGKELNKKIGYDWMQREIEEKVNEVLKYD